MPFFNYMGPGTHIIERIINNVQPVNKIDALAQKHDLDYLFATNDSERDAADDRAIQAANQLYLRPDEFIAAKFMSYGLTANKILRKVGLDFGK